VSTVGTLYEETVKLGTAKLLTVSNPAGVTSVALTMTDANFDTYLFELVLSFSQAANYLFSRWSNNGGSTWLSTESYFWQYAIMSVSRSPNVLYHSSNILGTGFKNHARLSLGTLGGYPLNGRLIFYRGSGTGGLNYMEWSMGHYASDAGWGWINHIGNCANNMTAPNAIQFYPDAGANMSGTIRMYGLRKGA
jgi:hypothetical protein